MVVTWPPMPTPYSLSSTQLLIWMLAGNGVGRSPWCWHMAEARQGLSEYWMLVPRWEWTADGNIEDSSHAGPLSPREKAKLHEGKEGTMAVPTGGKPGLPCSTFRTGAHGSAWLFA